MPSSLSLSSSSSTSPSPKETCCVTSVLSGTIFKDTICSFLTPQDIVVLFQVPALSESSSSFQLGHDYCRLHGTALDVYHEHSHNNDETSFLIYYLQQEAFFSKTQQDENLPSLSPQCLDCRLARLHEWKLCKHCDEYVPFHDDYGKCQDPTCGLVEGCYGCMGGIYQCTMCRGKEYCGDCHGDHDMYNCDGCAQDFCRDCLPLVSCCGVVCQACADNNAEEFFTCAECNKTSCFECNESPTFCSMCGTHYCDSCQAVLGCEECEEYACTTCRDVNYCDFCKSCYCRKCKDGYGGHGDWGCMDCLRRRGLVDLFQSKQNEEEGNLCANCFLSEDDMDGRPFLLFSCAACHSVKYCSRACQNAHAKEHSDDCATLALEHKAKSA